MSHLKSRLLGLVILIVFAGLGYYNWQQLIGKGQYSLKIAAFTPLGILGGIFLILFPGMGGKPETTKEKLIVMMVLVIGMAAGVVNVYLMNPDFFGR